LVAHVSALFFSLSFFSENYSHYIQQTNKQTKKIEAETQLIINSPKKKKEEEQQQFQRIQLPTTTIEGASFFPL
jgi:hypothetical protein